MRGYQVRSQEGTGTPHKIAKKEKSAQVRNVHLHHSLIGAPRTSTTPGTWVDIGAGAIHLWVFGHGYGYGF